MRLPALALALSLIAGCSNGPKSSPEGSVESYYDAANDQDFEAMVSILAPESLKRIGSKEKAMAHLQASFDGWSDFDVDVQDVRLDTSEKTGVVQFNCTAKVFFQKDRKHHPAGCNDLWSVIRQDDGRWYIVLPEAQRLKPML